MHNLSTPAYTPRNPSRSQVEFMNVWKERLEHCTFEESLQWAVETCRPQLAYATSMLMEDSIVYDMLRNIVWDVSAVDFVSQLLMPELWAPLTPEEMEPKTFDGLKASEALWERFGIEQLCKRYELSMRQYDVWIVGAHRDQDPRLERMSTVDWLDRFGVIRIAPLADFDIQAVEDTYNALSHGCVSPMEWNFSLNPNDSYNYEDMQEEELTSYHFFRGPASTKR